MRIVVRPQGPIKSIKELVESAKVEGEKEQLLRDRHAQPHVSLQAGCYDDDGEAKHGLFFFLRISYV